MHRKHRPVMKSNKSKNDLTTTSLDNAHCAVAGFLHDFAVNQGIPANTFSRIQIMSGPGGGFNSDFNKKILYGIRHQFCVVYHVRGTSANFILYNPDLGRDSEFMFEGKVYSLPQTIAKSVKTLWTLQAREFFKQGLANYFRQHG